MKYHPFHAFSFEISGLSEQFDQVPADCFTFAIRVSREEQGVSFLQCLLDGVDMLFIALDDLVLHGEIEVRIDRPFFGQQIAHMTIGGQHFVVLAKVLFDGLALGGRLDNDQILTHLCLFRLFFIMGSVVAKRRFVKPHLSRWG